MDADEQMREVTLKFKLSQQAKLKLLEACVPEDEFFEYLQKEGVEVGSGMVMNCLTQLVAESRKVKKNDS